MRTFFRFIALMTAVAFVVTAVAALFVVNLVQVVTNRNALKLSVGQASTSVVDTAPSLLIEEVRQQAADQGVALPDFDETAVAGAIAEIVPPEWVNVQADQTVDALFNALESGNSDAANVPLELAPVIENLRGESGQTAILTLMNSLPTCAEPADGPIDFLSGGVELPDCVPPNVPREGAAQEIHALLIETIDANPQLVTQADTVSVPIFPAGNTAAGQQAQQDFAQASRWFQLGQQWGWVLWLLPVGCLLLLLLLVVRNGRSLGLWWGWPMVVTGLVAFALVVFVPALLTWWWRTAAILPTDPTLANLALDEVGQHLLTALSGLWRGRIIWQAGVILSAGLLLLLTGYFSRPSTY